jgi:hypothetical protein
MSVSTWIVGARVRIVNNGLPQFNGWLGTVRLVVDPRVSGAAWIDLDAWPAGIRRVHRPGSERANWILLFLEQCEDATPPPAEGASA